MEVLHEVHACDGVRLPFDTACAVLDRHRHDIFDQATRWVASRSDLAPAMDWPDTDPHVVTAPLEREDGRAATMAMHWIQADPSDRAEGGLAAWIHAHVRLLPRHMGSLPTTELLLTLRSEVKPRDPGAFGDDLCASFLRVVAAELARRAPEGLPRS